MKLNQSVQKAAAILRAAARPDGETASGLARLAGLSHATSLRLVHTLENEGLLMRRGEDGRYARGEADAFVVFRVVEPRSRLPPPRRRRERLPDLGPPRPRVGAEKARGYEAEFVYDE
jgi:IclR helix-turn-helix domain